MTPTKLAALRKQIAEQPQGSWGRVMGIDLLCALDAANADRANLRELAEAVQDSMGSEGGIPMTDRLADAFARCGMDVERGDA
jgi:hypothetical protein